MLRNEAGLNGAISHGPRISELGEEAERMPNAGTSPQVSVHVKIALEDPLLESVGLGPLGLGHGG